MTVAVIVAQRIAWHLDYLLIATIYLGPASHGYSTSVTEMIQLSYTSRPRDPEYRL